MTIKQKVVNTISKHALIEPGDSILVALSAGADSVTLLTLLSDLRSKLKISVAAVYINHQIRKQAAKKEETFCQKLCDRLNIELHLISEDIPALANKNKKGIEETARDFRYGVFEMLSNEFGYSKVALGHHKDDRAETTLFRIIRGTGKSGLVGIKPQRGIYIRPLFDLTKDEILKYTKTAKISFCTDNSNKNTAYSRNYIRNKLLPDIRKNLNPAVDTALLTLSETTAEEDAFLQKIAERELKKVIVTTVGNKIILETEKFKKLALWLRRRILRYCLTTLSRESQSPDKQTVDRLDHMILSGTKAVSMPDKLEAKRIKSQIILFYRQKINFSQKLIPNEGCRLEKLNYIVSTCVKNRDKVTLKKQKRSLKAQFDLDKIVEPLIIRSVRPGDRFNPLGLKGSKKVSDLLTDSKIDTVLKDEVPVLVDKNSVFWVVGFEIDNRVKIDSNTKKVLEIEFLRR